MSSTNYYLSTTPYTPSHEPDDALEAVAEQLEYRFGQAATREIVPRIKNFGNVTYVNVLKNTIDRDQTYGTKTRYRALYQTIHEIVTLGENENGRWTQTVFEVVKNMMDNPEELPIVFDDSCIQAITHYIRSRADIFQVEKTYLDDHLKTSGVPADLRYE